MAAGSRLLADGSLERLSVGEIARHAGVSRALLYHYFPTKQALVRAVVRHEILRLHDLVDQAEDGTVDSAVDTFVGYVSTHPEAIRMLHAGGLDRDPDVAAALQVSFRRYEDLLLRRLGAPASQEGPRLAVRIWVRSMIPLCLTWIDHPSVSQDTAVRMAVRSLHALVAAVQEDDQLDQPDQEAGQVTSTREAGLLDQGQPAPGDR